MAFKNRAFEASKLVSTKALLVKLQTVSLPRSPLPEANYIELPSVAQGRKGESRAQGPCLRLRQQ